MADSNLPIDIHTNKLLGKFFFIVEFIFEVKIQIPRLAYQSTSL